MNANTPTNTVWNDKLEEYLQMLRYENAELNAPAAPDVIEPDATAADAKKVEVVDDEEKVREDEQDK